MRPQDDGETASREAAVRLGARFGEVFPELPLRLRDYEFEDLHVRVLWATVPFEDGASAHLVCSVAADPRPRGVDRLAHEHHFFGLYEGGGKEMELALAALHRHHLLVAALDVGHQVPTAPGSALARAGYSHLLVDEPWMFWPIAPAFRVGPAGLVSGLRLLAVAPARPDERATHREQGLSAFLDARIQVGETPLTVRL